MIGLRPCSLRWIRFGSRWTRRSTSARLPCLIASKNSVVIYCHLYRSKLKDHENKGSYSLPDLITSSNSAALRRLKFSQASSTIGRIFVSPAVQKDRKSVV